MVRQLALNFGEEWWMKVITSLPKDQKEEAVSAWKEMLRAFVEKRNRGKEYGQCRN